MRSLLPIHVLASLAATALLLAGCEGDGGVDITVGSTSAAPGPLPSAPSGAVVAQNSACNLLPRDEVAPVLGPDTVVEFSGEVRCRYEAGDRLLAIQLERLDVILESLADFVTKHGGSALSEPIDGIGQAAYFNRGASTINIAVGAQQLELRVVLDPFSADYNVNTDKTAERTALINWARAAVGRL